MNQSLPHTPKSCKALRYAPKTLLPRGVDENGPYVDFPHRWFISGPIADLPPDIFWAYIHLVHLASHDDDWLLPSLAKTAADLRKTKAEAQRLIDALVAADLFIITTSGALPSLERTTGGEA